MTSVTRLAGVVLAAGQGTRLNSARPKVLHPLGGRPLVDYAVQAVGAATGSTPLLVVGPDSAEVRAALGNRAGYAVQPEALGTADAVRHTRDQLQGQCDAILVSYADMPLLRPETLRALVEAQSANPGPLTLLSLRSPRRGDFGRVVRDSAGRAQAVVEAAQATAEQLQIAEVNVGAYCVNADWLWPALERLPLSPKGEYYITDLVGLAASEGQAVASVTIEDEDEVVGINNRVQLAEAEAALRRRINKHWML